MEMKVLARQQQYAKMFKKPPNWPLEVELEICKNEGKLANIKTFKE